MTENSLKRHQHWMLAALSALLLFLSFPNANLFPFAWVALVPLFVAFRHAANGKSAFWIGYLTGFLFFGGLLTAIALLHPYANIFATMFGYLLLVGYTALYFGVFPVLMRIVPWRSGVLFPVAAAALWTALEWVRSWLMTGFPWGSIGYSQWNNLLGIQIASLVGVHGISFVIVLFNAGIATPVLQSASMATGDTSLSFTPDFDVPLLRLRCLPPPRRGTYRHSVRHHCQRSQRNVKHRTCARQYPTT